MNSKYTMMSGVPRFTSSISVSTYFNWPEQWIVDIAKDIITTEELHSFMAVKFDKSGDWLAFSWELKDVFDSGCIVIWEET